jgi:2'-5' RNA ligase
MGEARSHRVFFALWPDHEAVAQLSALAHSLGGGGRLMRPASLHLTLAFVGSVTPTQLEVLGQIGTRIRGAAFDLSLDRIGFWPQRGILWAGCNRTPPPLRDLAGRMASALRESGFAVDSRAGSALLPHVTLARRVRCGSLPRLDTPIRWRADEFTLVESHLHPSAASYRILARFALDAAGPEAD